MKWLLTFAVSLVSACDSESLRVLMPPDGMLRETELAATRSCMIETKDIVRGGDRDQAEARCLVSKGYEYKKLTKEQAAKYMSLSSRKEIEDYLRNLP